MRYKRLGFYTWLSFVSLLSLLNAEPSAFELQSGATKKDLKNIRSANKNLENIAIDYSTRIQSLEQSQEGLKSIAEGQALRIRTLTDSISKQDNLIKTLQSDIEKQKAIIEQLNSKVSELTTLVTKINQDILSQLNNLKNAPTTSTSKTNTKQSNTTNKQNNASTKQNQNTQKSTQSNKDKLEEANKLYRSGKLDQAKELYKQLVSSNHRTAYASYMLGEIAYQQNSFKEAISFYKKSASLDEKASYMPILLWHTAWAFRYSRDMTNYNKFLDSLIYLYPESEQGKKAKDLKNKQKA